MKCSCLFFTSLLGGLLVTHPLQAQTLKIPNFSRPTITTPQITLPTARPNITTPNISTPRLTPQTSISFPTTTTTVSVPSFPNVNNLGDRLIQSPQTIKFPSQTLPTKFLPASITPPNNLNSTLPLAVIVPQFPNFQPSSAANSVAFLNAVLGTTSPNPFPSVTPTSNQLQLVPTLITFPKQNPQISIPTLSNLTTITQPTVTNNLSSDSDPNTIVGVGLRIVAPTLPQTDPPTSSTFVKNSFILPSGFETNGGAINLTLD